MPGRIEIQLEIHIRRNGALLFKPATINLLRAIQREGSLSTAARRMHISYQHAWAVIDSANRAASQPMATKQRGGTGGGGTMLTAYGVTVLREYGDIEREVAKFTKRLNAELNM
jgi:molybdate transport system regulatory protein